MARLPVIQPRGAVVRGAQSSVSAADVANPYRQIAEGLETFGQAFEKQGIVEAQQAGQNAVYRDSNGVLQVNQASNFSASGRAYNAAAQQGYTARLAGDIRTRGTQLANDSKGNIDAFDSSWKAFRDQTIAAVPKDQRGAVTTMLDTEGPRFRLGVSEQKRTSDIKEFEGNIKSEIQFLDDDMATLARSGGVNTDAYRQKQAQIHTLYQSLADNPDFTVGQQEADIALKRMESRHMTESMLGNVDKALQGGGLAEARKLSQAILTDEKLSLSPAERRQYSSLANERINGFIAQTKANLKPAQDLSKTIQKRLKEGVGLDDDDVDTTARSLAQGGDMSGALELYQARATAKTLQGFRLSDNPQQVAMAEQAIRGGSSGGSGVVDKIIGVESGGNPNAQNPNSSAGGAGQFIDSTWLAMVHKYRPDVAAGKSAQDIIALKKDASLSREMTARYTQENQDFLRNQGIQPTDGNTYLAHFLGPRGAAEVLKADRGASVASIVGPDVVNANSFLQGMTAGDVIAWADKKMGGAGVTSAVDPEIVKEYRQEMTSDARDLFTQIKGGLDKGLTPVVSDVDLLSRQLALVDDQDFRKEVSDYFASDAVKQAAQNVAPAQLESLISSLQADASDGATIAEQQILTGLQDAQRVQQQALNDDPIGYAARRGMIAAPSAIDLGNPDSWGPTFQSLQKGVDVLQSQNMVGNISALRPEMQKQVASALETSTPQQAVQLLGSMAANMRPETYKATLAKLYSSGQGGAASAAGALVSVNPAVAEGVLRGQQLLKENPLLAPKKTDDNTVTVNGLLPTTAFAPVIEGARQNLLDAARARYADLSNQVGDTSGELDETRMTQAITEVTGGLVDINGSQTVAPRYGMSQDDFDNVLGSLTDADLEGAITSSGVQVKAEDLRNEGRLRAVADGRYVLEFGSPDSPTYVLRRPSQGNYRAPSAYVLDLRGR